MTTFPKPNKWIADAYRRRSSSTTSSSGWFSSPADVRKVEAREDRYQTAPEVDGFDLQKILDMAG